VFEDGIILDASAAQMGFFGEQVARAECYASSKIITDNENCKQPFGTLYIEHVTRFRQSTWVDIDHDSYFVHEATFRVTNHVLYCELERLGGAKKVLALDCSEWEEAKQQITGTLTEHLQNLRKELDNIDFVEADEEKKQKAKKILMARLD
jgi:hypothetical protein